MKRFICIAAILLLLAVNASADNEVFDSAYDILELGELEDSKPKDAEEIKLKEDISFDGALPDIWDKVKSAARETVGTGFRCVSVIIAISMLSEIVNALFNGNETPTVRNCVSIVAAIGVTAAASGSLNTVVGMGKSFLEEIDVFSKALLPTLAAAEASCGLPGAAMARSTAAVLFSDVLITLVNYALMPLMYIGIFSATANAATPSKVLAKISDLSVKAISCTLKIALGAFVSYITVTGIISGNVDKAGLKTAQFAIGGAVPVVGGIISEAAETVIAGASLLKNAIGVFGMLSILSACVTPFITLGINYFIFKLASVLASPVIEGNISELTDRIGTSFGVLLAMSASCATVIFLSIIMSMSAIGVL